MSQWSGAQTYSFAGLLGSGATMERMVHCKGRGASVLLLQELPGIGPETLGLAERLVADGFRVHIPQLIGPLGALQPLRNTLRVVCIRREFGLLKRGAQGHLSSWLRALGQEIKKRDLCDGIGVIGMCLTGSFAIAMMADDAVLGAVASQPSLPVLGRGALPMSREDVREIKDAMKRKGPVLAMRYKGDHLASKTLFDSLRSTFSEGLETHEFAGSKHSLLTLHFNSEAYDRASSYLCGRLESSANKDGIV